MQEPNYNNQNIRLAILSAESYIWNRVTERGWTDFKTPIGESTEWVTGYILSSLRKDPKKYIILNRIAQYLCETQRRNGGWGYNPKAPADADSTSMILNAFAGESFIPQKKLERAAQFLMKLQDRKRGGFKTYGYSLSLRFLMRSFRVSIMGWCSPHIDVTAAAVVALVSFGLSVTSDKLEKARNFLERNIRKDGLWQAYWWRGPYYGTAMTISALGVFRNVFPLDLGNTRKSLIALQLGDGSWDHLKNGKGSAFSTALALLTLFHLDPLNSVDSITRGLNWLLEYQNSDGSWESVPIMQIPHPYDTQPSEKDHWREDGLGSGVIIRDQHRLFTSATVLRTLYEYGLRT